VDPDPLHSDKREPDPVPHRFADDKPKLWNMSLSEHFFKVLTLYLAARIRIRIKVTSRIRILIRIRIKVTSRIRIRIRIPIKVTSRIRIRICIKAMRIRNTAGYTNFFGNS
jgi:hypothetical protein